MASFTNIFKVRDLRNKVIFTLFIIAVYELGASVTVPGASLSAVHSLEAQAKQGGILGFLNLFTGGGLTRVAVFGLGIMPYITSSIIIQLLVTVIPKLEEWQEQGAVGQRKLTQTTRYLTISLAILQSTGLAFAFHSGSLFGGATSIDLIPNFTVPRVMFIVLTLTAGTAVVMWLGELITQRGVGQGMSIIIFTEVVAALPGGGGAVLTQGGKLKFAIVILLAVFLLVSITFMELGQRRVPITFAKRVMGRREYGGLSSYIPLKVNQAGVIPVIFASSVLYFPVLLSNVIPSSAMRTFINNQLQPTSLWYIGLYGVFTVLFTFFYVSIQFDPAKQADIIRKQGGYIPGVRPGPPTQRYLSQILYRLTLPGSLFLAAVAILPAVVLALWHINSLPFVGVTLLIAVGVSLETMKQIDSQLMMRNYDGFLAR